MLVMEPWRTLSSVPGAPTLLTTSEDVFIVPKACGHHLGINVLCGQIMPVTVRDLITTTPKGFLGTADLDDITLYTRLVEFVGLELKYIGTSDDLLHALEVPLTDVLIHSDVDEARRAADLLEKNDTIAQRVGAGILSSLRAGHFVANPLPWCVRHDAVGAYVGIIRNALTP